MAWRLLADLVVLLHLAFVAFAVAGGLLALRWRWLPWLHLPALAWGVWISASAGSASMLRRIRAHIRRVHS